MNAPAFARGDCGLFLDRWEYCPARGVNSVIESILDGIAMHPGARVTLADMELPEFSAFNHVVITAPLDEFNQDEAILEGLCAADAILVG